MGHFKKYDHKFSGRNSRLDSINAAVLNIKLKNINEQIKKRNLLAGIYYKELKNNKHIKLFKLSNQNVSTYHQFVIRCDTRNALKKYLSKFNIDTMIHYPYMLNELDFFSNKSRLKKSFKLGNKILSLPISEEHTKKEINYISRKINDFLNLKTYKNL